MFPRLITRYGLATHLALLASLPFVLFPFLPTPRLAELIFWLSGIAFLWLLVEPSMRAGEHLSIARRRVLGSLVRDVAFWFVLLTLVISGVRYFNCGISTAYSVQENVKSSESYSESLRREFPSDPAKRRSWLDNAGGDAGLRARTAAIVMLEEAFAGDETSSSARKADERENATLRNAKSRVIGATDHQAIVFARKLADLGGKVKGEALGRHPCMRYLPHAVSKGEWIVREPVYVGLPASAGSSELLPLSVLLGIGVVVLGLRHGVGLTGRISFGLTASFVMGLGGLLMTIFACLQVPSFMGAAKAEFLEGPFREPFWGPGFGAWLICALPFGAQAESRKWGAARVPHCLAVAGNVCGLLFFSPPPVSTVFLIVAVLVAIFCLAYLGRAGSVGASARNFVMILLGFATPLFFLTAILPEEIEFDGCVRKVGSVMEPVKEPAQNIYSVKAGGFLAIDKVQAEEYRKLSPMLSGMAKAIWKKHPWYGAGTGAFRLHVPFVATKEQVSAFRPPKSDDWRTLLVTQQMKNNTSRRANEAKTKNKSADEFDWKSVRPYNRNPVRAYNSYWTLLAERGLLGATMALLGLGILLFSYFYRFAKAFTFLRTQDDADVFVFACPPIVWVAPFVFALLCVLAFYEPILDIVPLLFAFTVPLAVAAASFPKNPASRQRADQTLEKESP